MFNDSFSKIPTELIKSKQLSNLEFRVICVLILISSYNNGHSFLGSFKLSDMCGIGRAALRKALNNLEKMQLVKITQRGQFSRSNDILLTIPDGIRFLQCGSTEKKPRRVDLNDSPCVDLKDSPMVDLNDSRVDLNDSRVDLNDSPIKNIDLNNLNLNKNRPVDLNDSPDKKENTVKKDIATADVAAVRSMPTGEQVAGNTQQKEVIDAAKAAKERESMQVISDYFGDKMAWIQVFKVSNKIGFRVLGGRISGVEIDVAKEFAARHNFIYADNQQFADERILTA